MSAALIKQMEERLARQDAELAAMKKQPLPNSITPADATGSAHGRRWQPGDVPGHRKGHDTMSSRPFRFINLFGAMIKDDPSIAPTEIDLATRFRKSIRDTGFTPHGASAVLPLGLGYLPDDIAFSDEAQTLKSMMCTGAPDDPQEVAWTMKKAFSPLAKKGYMPAVQKMQSAWNASVGGDLVAPPEFGEIIELLRNQEALVNAGARTIQLPAQGQIVFPRITSPTTAQALGENVAINDSTVGTGHLTLSAKKIAGFVQVPNELFRYATSAAEAIIRNDLTKTLALTADLYFLEGNGANNTPKGITLYNDANGIVQYQNQVAPLAPRGIGANGNSIFPEDGYNMAALIEENNAMLEGWIMRPTMWSTIGGYRADAVTAGDAAGAFVQSLFRSMMDNLDPAWDGYPITKTNQISRSRIKGASSNLTYILGGMWSDFLIGLFGAIEFLATNVADTPFKNDLTWIRGIMLGDAGPRHTGAFVMFDQLIR